MIAYSFICDAQECVTQSEEVPHPDDLPDGWVSIMFSDMESLQFCHTDCAMIHLATFPARTDEPTPVEDSEDYE